jgi:bifunctional UDP-N-acetylglucosamine pyrophosphorylase/glucosamine-1-phosphate N-acetyltransferase
MPNLSIVILAAGLGTRMKSKKAKVLHEAGGLTLIEHVVNTALELAPPERVLVVLGRQAAEVEAAVASRGVGFVVQREQAGSGHALLVSSERVAPLGGDVAVLYGDCPLLSAATLRKLIDLRTSTQAAASVITTILADPAGYGRILRDPDGSVRAIVEQKAATPEQLAIREINSGIYCFSGELVWRYLNEVQPNQASGEIYLTDVVELFRNGGHAVYPLLLDDATEVLGINTRADLAQVDAAFRMRKARQLMLDGVTIEKPESVAIDMSVRIGRDSVIEPFVRILGRTVIGEDCRIGACSIVRDSELADRVEVRPFTMIDSCRIEPEARVGPYSRLRMNAHVKAGALVGNFVELKNTELGEGAKSQHLAYLGDATIGGGANIGAGTITCNYDGQRKHRTKIGDGAFVGSNATLVAPVEIGAGSYIAAGSVVTDSVPPDALALGRARQVVKEGWAKKRRQK